MKNIFNKKSFQNLFFAAIVGFAAGPSANSVNIDIPATPIPGQKAFSLSELSQIIGILGRFLVAVAPVLLVISLIWSGILYMKAGGSDTKVAEAKKWFGYAIVGGLIIFGVGVIINTVAAVITREFFCQLSVLGICIY